MKTYGDLFRKNLLACIFGPLAILPATLLYALAFKIFAPESNQNQVDVISVFILVGLIVAYPLTLIIGVPLTITLEKLNKLNLSNILLATVGLVSFYAVVQGGSFLGYLFILYFAVWVAICSWYFYKIA